MALPKLYDRIIWHNNTTPALNEDNLNAMSKGLDDVDDRLIDLAGTIMEDVPQILEDMEILGPAVENIDENVARAEAAADSAEQYAEEIAPPIEVVKDFAPIITIEDAINKPAKDVKLKVEAVQDLHGYTKPWVGGAGKNKLPLTVASIKAANTGTWSGNTLVKDGITWTILTDNDDNVIGIDATGTANGYNAAQIRVIDESGYLADGQYILSGMASGVALHDNTYVRLLSNNNTAVLANIQSSSSEATFTVDSSNVPSRVMLSINNGTVVNHVVFRPMIRLATVSDATFETYTNICPISGFTEAKIDRYRDTTITYDPSSNDKYIGADGTIGISGLFHYTNLLPVVQASYKYRYTCTTLNNFSTRVHAYNENGVWLRQLAYKTSSGQSIGENEITFDVDSSVSYIRISQSTEVSDELLMHDNTQYIIDLDGTRYGGTLDVTSGVLTVDRQYLTIDKDLITAFSINNGVACGFTDGNYTEDCIKMCDSFEIKANPFGYEVNTIGARSDGRIVLMPTWGQSATTLAEFKTAMGSQVVNVVYELATPQTITITPTEVELLLGYNTLWADTGDLSLTYDASGVLRIANAKLDIDTFKSVVAASSDFADFKTKVAAL